MMVEIGNNIKRGNYIPYRWCKVVYNHLEINGVPMYLTEVYVKKNDFRIVLLDYDDMTLGDYDNTGENEQVAYFINYCLNQDKDGKE